MAEAAAAAAGCSEAESEVVRGFLEAAIHTILHHRAVYPPELFELRRQYNVAVQMARPPALREYIASLLTADMNQAGERLRSWHRGDELVWDPAGFALVGYIGHFNEDLRPESLVPRQISFTLLPGERLVLCSDGITDYVSVHHPGAAEVIAEGTWGLEPVDAATTLIHAANRGGGGDNCTAIVAMVVPRGDDPTEELGS